MRYGIDTKYLEKGEQYLVGASVDPAAGVLVVEGPRAAEPLFGGDEVIGAAESDVDCPVIDDPVRTLPLDGTPVDAGVLSPLTDAKREHAARRSCCRSASPSASIFGLVAAALAAHRRRQGRRLGRRAPPTRATREVRRRAMPQPAPRRISD